MLMKKNVSILVLMDLPFLRTSAGFKCIYGPGVSILVLMDLPFLHQTGGGYAAGTVRFNPCSYGSSVLTLQNVIA